MPIKITPELEEKVHIIFSSGNYRTENQVLDEALKLLEQRDQLRRKLQVGVEQLDHGERINGDEMFSELRNGIDHPAGAVSAKPPSSNTPILRNFS